MTSKVQETTRNKKEINWMSSKLKTCPSMDTIKKVKENTQNGKEHLQTIHLIRD